MCLAEGVEQHPAVGDQQPGSWVCGSGAGGGGGGRPHTSDILCLPGAGAGVRGDGLPLRALPESPRDEEVDHRNERRVPRRDGGIPLQVRD